MCAPSRARPLPIYTRCPSFLYYFGPTCTYPACSYRHCNLSLLLTGMSSWDTKFITYLVGSFVDSGTIAFVPCGLITL